MVALESLVKGEKDPWVLADWGAAWRQTTVSEADWKRLREELGKEARSLTERGRIRTRTVARSIGAGCAVAACLSEGLQSQAVVRAIPKEPECARCQIVAERVSTISDIEAADPIANGLAVMDRRGRIFLVSDRRRFAVEVFDSTGRHLKTVGRLGSGPAEFKEIRSVLVGAGDSIHVFDASTGRRSVLSPTTLAVVRSQTWTARALAQMNWLSPTRFVAANWNYSKAPASRAIHVLDSAGKLLLGLDGGPDSTRGGLGAEAARSVTADGQGGIFAAHASIYQVDHWNVDGRLVESFRRDIPWFPPVNESAEWRPFDKGRNPAVTIVDRAPDGLVWVMVRVRDRDWKRALVTRHDEAGKEVQYPDDWNEYDDTIIEILNPKTGRIVASQRFDPAFLKFVRPGYSLSVTDDPEPLVTIWRLRLVRP